MADEAKGAGNAPPSPSKGGGGVRETSPDPPTPHPAPPPQGGREPDASPAKPRKLTPEALRALAEAEERRKAAAAEARPEERGGRDGPEPVRYGDWEKKGIAVDF